MHEILHEWRHFLSFDGDPTTPIKNQQTQFDEKGKNIQFALIPTPMVTGIFREAGMQNQN